MADAIATQPGKPVPRIDKRLADDRVYSIDCTLLLRADELLTQVTSAEGAGLELSGARTRQGKAMEIRIAGGAVPPNMPYKDHAVAATLKTTRGSIGIAFDVRVYR